jgi:NAD(P)-dependent dehydrogenase (short-subunit alcohol dehydrogenase family)
MSKLALIIGAGLFYHRSYRFEIFLGPGISIQFGKRLAASGYRVAVASRSLEKLTALAQSIGATPFTVDCASTDSVVGLFTDVETQMGGPPDVVLYNTGAGFNNGGECGTLSYDKIAESMQISSISAFVAVQEAGKRMIPRGQGAIFLTGATGSFMRHFSSISYICCSAGVKAFPEAAVFAMGKFALRGMAQSMYKELSPKGIHVCHFVIDGGIRPYPGERVEDLPRGSFTADVIADSYMLALAQPQGAWSWEIELRGIDETF